MLRRRHASRYLDLCRARQHRCSVWTPALSTERFPRSDSRGGYRFDPLRLLCRIRQHIAQALYRGIQAVVEVNKRVVRPKLDAKFLSRHQLARSFHQQHQDAERLFAQPNSSAKLPHLTRAQVDLIGSEPCRSRCCSQRIHVRQVPESVEYAAGGWSKF